MDTFTHKFADCFCETEESQFSPQTKFRELDEWNSMLALIVIAMVDTDFQKELTADDIRSSITISDLYHKISTK